MTGHIAQLNIARLIAPKDDPRVAEFMENLERINGLGKRSDGFVWLMEGADGAAGNTDTFIGDDPQMIANLSVWRDVASLRHFVFNTLHKQFMARSAAWFEPPDGPRFVMWPVAAGHRPDLAEGLARLAQYRSAGASAEVFGWAEAGALDGAEAAS